MQNFIIERTEEYINAIAGTVNRRVEDVEVLMSAGKEKTGNWKKYDGAPWGGYDVWGWFGFDVTIPEELTKKLLLSNLKKLRVTVGQEVKHKWRLM